MKGEELIEDDLDSVTPPFDEKIKYSNEAIKHLIFKKQLKEFEESLIHKLPNEFRNALKGYNFRNESDFLIDKNNYKHF
jgi:hypothetical protein